MDCHAPDWRSNEENKMNRILLMTFAAAVSVIARGDGEITGTASSPVSVDLRTGFVAGALGTANIRYSPRWTDNAASVRLEAVSGGVTNVIKSGTAGEEGIFAWTQPNANQSVYTLLQWTLLNGTPVDEPLSAKVSFGIQSATPAVTAADTQADSLQKAVDAGNARLVYDTAWGTNAAAVTLKAVRLSGAGGNAVATNEIFSAVADAKGTTTLKGVSPGWWRLLCQETDALGNTVLEYVTGVFRRKGGFILSVE